MAVLTANVDNLVSSDPGMSAAKMYQATTIFKGSWVIYNAGGFAIAATDTTGCFPAGLASDQVVNAGSSGAKEIPLWTSGEVDTSFDALTQDDVGKIAYAYDSGSLTIDTSTHKIPMAIVRKYISSTRGRVEIIVGKGYTNIDTDLYPMEIFNTHICDIVDAGNIVVLTANKHPDCKLIGGRVLLNEVPDATAKTITVRVFRSGDAADMTDLLTFTQGTETANAIKNFAVDGTDHTTLTDDGAYITVGGDSTTLGQVEVILHWQFVR